MFEQMTIFDWNPPEIPAEDEIIESDCISFRRLGNTCRNCYKLESMMCRYPQTKRKWIRKECSAELEVPKKEDLRGILYDEPYCPTCGWPAGGVRCTFCGQKIDHSKG